VLKHLLLGFKISAAAHFDLFLRSLACLWLF
jgi:hypothetical protein